MSLLDKVTENNMSQLIQATQLFVEAKHFESIGQYRKADALFAKCDKLMRTIFEEFQKAKAGEKK
jgi:hypothetical protein